MSRPLELERCPVGGSGLCCRVRESSSPGGVLLHPRRDADPARLGQCLELRRDVYPVSKDVPVLDHDIADVKPHPKLDAPVFRHRNVLFGDACLDLVAARRCVHDTAKLGQEPITCRFDEAPVVRGDRRVDYLGPDGNERTQSAGFVSRARCHGRTMRLLARALKSVLHEPPSTYRSARTTLY